MSTPAAPSAPAPTSIVVGIDLGTETTSAQLGLQYGCELVRNAHGGHDASTAVTFPSNSAARLIGEDAADSKRADGNTASQLDRLLPGLSGDDDDVLGAFRRFEFDAEASTVTVPNLGGDAVSSAALVAALLGKVRTNVLSTVKRLSEGQGSDDESATAASPQVRFVFAVPPDYPPAARDALVDAAHAATGNVGSVTVDAPECTAAVYERKFGNARAPVNCDTRILVVDVGHARTCASVLVLEEREQEQDEAAMDVDADESASNEEKKESSEKSEGRTCRVLSVESHPSLGAGNIDVRLWHHFRSNVAGLSELKPNSRAGQRLLAGCNKLKTLLSMLPEGKVSVENIGPNDTDVSLSATRELLRELCVQDMVNVRSLVRKALSKASDGSSDDGSIQTVEICGGGCRIPMMQDAIREALGERHADLAFSRTLDDASLALGATLIDSSKLDSECEMDEERVQRRAALLEGERSMAARDAAMAHRDEVRNRIEAHVLEMRAAKNGGGPHSSLLPASDEFTTHLDTTDDWLFSQECDDAGVPEMESKWKAVEEKTNEMCAEYLAAIKADAERKDREMEAEAKAAAVERAAGGGDDDEEDDHDNRRLGKARRMEIVMKNKAEANELFSGKNYRHAAARYAKALTHCSKFFDLSPDDEKEVRDVKLTLNLNLALMYIKLEKYDNALRSCDDALEIDKESVKALFRRASVLFEKKKYDEALRDCKKALAITPDNKEIKKLRVKVDRQIAQQKKKQKAMAQKMFG